MTREELNYIKDAFSQIIDDIAGNPDWYEAARAIASNLGTLERKLEKRVSSLPSNLNEAAKTHAQIEGDEEYGRYNIEKYEDFKTGAEWMAGLGKTVEGYISLRGKRSLITVLDKLEEFKFADKVIVQIRKEQ